jgi:NAD(P)-dependent dehydrogenase (short-subunit alcohol dehydrogenase family)
MPESSKPAGDHADLRGRTVIVSGGSRGLGAAIAQVLGECGARIVIADIAIERAYDRVAVLTERGIAAAALAVDVGDEAQVARLFEFACAEFGGVHALINNAAIDVTLPIAQLPVADWERIVRTNLSGPFVMAKHAAACMTRQGQGGHIVNITSTAAKRAWPNASAYHATKWGLLGLSHALHAELRPQGIKVCAVVAGGMRTPFLLERFADIDPGVLQDPLQVARAVRFVLLQDAETVVPEITVLPMRETSWP